jgi:ribosomal protein L3 glutamine methyltransferase
MTELHTIRDFLRFALSEFGRHPIELGHGTDSLWDEALALVFGALSLPPDGDERLLDASLTSDEQHYVLGLIHKRVHERIPVPYLTKKAWYAGLPFIVDERVLIPRSPIFEMIESEFKPWFDAPVERPIRFLDLCTGSGCLGITTALAFPESTGVLADLESGACQVARENIDFHQVGDRLEVIQSDGFDALFYDTFDVIICNPPYVDAEDMADLPPEYRKEPEIALASGDDGLELVRRLLSQASDWLADDGLMILEVGNTWGLLDREVTARMGESVQWIEFEFGGHGVCVLSKHELNALYSAF